MVMLTITPRNGSISFLWHDREVVGVIEGAAIVLMTAPLVLT